MSKSVFVYEKDTTEETIDKLMDVVSCLKEKHQAEVKEYNTKLQTSIPTLQKLIPQPDTRNYGCGTWNIGKRSADAFMTTTYWSTHVDLDSVSKLEERYARVTEVCKRYIEDCEKVYNENLPIIENNKRVQEYVTSVMKYIGIPDKTTKSYYKNNRSRKMTTETVSSGYVEDMQQHVGISQPSVLDLDRLMYSINQEYNKRKSALVAKEREAEIARKKKEEEHGIALLRAKYTPDDAMSCEDDILTAILDKNKYLHLAHWLEMNRKDWSDGYHYAEIGYNGFVVETDEDEKIDNELSSILNDDDRFCIDGRIFRDCEYNYNVLFGMVEDQQLMEDYNKIMGSIDEI